ncbi:hypothetical protein HRbin36_02500 [bacterium HR36]|nr:hypothetical protein HRbin36_02500 [bacterium HR36]
MPEEVTATANAEARGGYLSPHEVIIGAPRAGDVPRLSEPTANAAATTPCCMGYDTRHLLPSFVLGVTGTFIALAGLVWLNARLPAWLAPLVASIVWASLAATWAFLLFRWAYRGLFWRVEFNDREVIYRRGWLWPKAVVALAELARVEVRQSWWQRLLGFGHIALISEKPEAAPLLLIGLPQPQLLAEQLTQRLQQARQQQVHEGHISVANSVHSLAR